MTGPRRIGGSVLFFVDLPAAFVSSGSPRHSRVSSGASNSLGCEDRTCAVSVKIHARDPDQHIPDALFQERAREPALPLPREDSAFSAGSSLLLGHEGRFGRRFGATPATYALRSWGL